MDIINWMRGRPQEPDVEVTREIARKRLREQRDRLRALDVYIEVRGPRPPTRARPNERQSN